MTWYHCVSYLFGGVFLTNAIPHLVSGLMGRSFHSPFAKPPVKGLSSPTVNVIWGAFNLAIGYSLVYQVGTFDPRNSVDALMSGSGALLTAISLSRIFGRSDAANV